MHENGSRQTKAESKELRAESKIEKIFMGYLYSVLYALSSMLL